MKIEPTEPYLKTVVWVCCGWKGVHNSRGWEALRWTVSQQDPEAWEHKSLTAREGGLDLHITARGCLLHETARNT